MKRVRSSRKRCANRLKRQFVGGARGYPQGTSQKINAHWSGFFRHLASKGLNIFGRQSLGSLR